MQAIGQSISTAGRIGVNGTVRNFVCGEAGSRRYAPALSAVRNNGRYPHIRLEATDPIADKQSTA